jgi:hypothetical protein
MPIVDLYSSRRKAQTECTDVFEFDKIPERLRVQVWNIVEGAFGAEYSDPPHTNYDPDSYYLSIEKAVAHEHGREHLTARPLSPRAAVAACLKLETDLFVWLDVVELSFRYIENLLSKRNDGWRKDRKITIAAADAIVELNERCRRAGFGYRFEKGIIIRIDSEYLHAEVTKPALLLLQDSQFAGADDEFRSAHDHYKAGEYRDCAVDANNALESTMKTICEAKGWPVQKGARASDLIKILRREGLFPEFADQSFEQLFATLKSGLPALRNDTGGHGQGTTLVEVPEYVAAYSLHLAASKIRFLYEAFRASGP